MNRFLGSITLALMAVVASSGTQAQQAYPQHIVKIIVGFPPGQAADIVARIIADKIAGPLGQPVIVDNQAGQAGSIAIAALKKAPPDGHTMILAATASLVINPHLYGNVTYDPLKDFEPIGLVADGPLMLVVNPALPVNNVAELIAYAKVYPDKLNYASPGNGAVSHLAMEVFKRHAGISIAHVPYPGSMKAITDVMNGSVQVAFDTIAVTRPQIDAHKLKALAVAGPTRLELYPNVPALQEVGFPGFVASPWIGLLFPAGTPRPLVDRINTVLNEALRTPEMREKLLGMGLFLRTGTPDEFSAVLRSDFALWGKAVRESGAKVD